MAQRFSARVYGHVEGQAPFQNESGQTSFSRFKDIPSPQIVSFPAGSGAVIHALPNGYQAGNGSYVYSVIEVTQSGLNVHSQKFASDSSAAALATAAG
jgi:hypothetical protein